MEYISKKVAAYGQFVLVCSLSLSLELIIYLYLIYRYREEGGTLGNAPTGATAAVLVPVETE